MSDPATETVKTEPAPESAVKETPAPAPEAKESTTAEPAKAGPGEAETKEAPAAEPSSQAAELKLPEGIEVDKQFLEKAQAAWKEVGMPVEHQQKTLDMYVEYISAQTKAFEEMQAKQRADWREQIKADPELGGAKLEATLATVAKARDKFFGEDAVKLMELTGLGDHPAFVRALYQIGARVSEDTIAGTVTEAPKQFSLANVYDHPTSRKLLK